MGCLRDGALQAKAPSLWQAVALLLLAIGVQVQLALPVGLKICPADAVAALLATQMLLYRRHRTGPLCLSRTLPHWLVACTMVLAVSVAIGFFRSGHISTWALGNKLIGWGVLLAAVTGAISPRSLMRSALYALACGLTLELARDLMFWIAQVPQAGADLPKPFIKSPALILYDTTAGSSDLQRLSSYSEAVELWLTAPVFGAGLGTALEASIARHGTPLIIHSAALWLLAETGIIGLGWAVTRPLFPLRSGDDRACFRLAALLMLVLFGIMSLAHEMLYQRVLWLMLGLALAIPRAKADQSCAD